MCLVLDGFSITIDVLNETITIVLLYPFLTKRLFCERKCQFKRSTKYFIGLHIY